MSQAGLRVAVIRLVTSVSRLAVIPEGFRSTALGARRVEAAPERAPDRWAIVGVSEAESRGRLLEATAPLPSARPAEGGVVVATLILPSSAVISPDRFADELSQLEREHDVVVVEGFDFEASAPWLSRLVDAVAVVLIRPTRVSMTDVVATRSDLLSHSAVDVVPVVVPPRK
jgi:hypothetical protein